MEQHAAHERSLIDRLASLIPGYSGYLGRADRRAADKLLRDAVADRLRVVRGAIDDAIRSAVDRAALDSITGLERGRQRLDRLADRLRAAGSGTDAFYQGSASLDAPKANTIHGFDLNLYQRADHLAQLMDKPEALAGLDSELDLLEQALDERARWLQGLR